MVSSPTSFIGTAQLVGSFKRHWRAWVLALSSLFNTRWSCIQHSLLDENGKSNNIYYIARVLVCGFIYTFTFGRSRQHVLP